MSNKKTTSKILSSDQKRKLKKWLAEKILTVVMTKAGGLPGMAYNKDDGDTEPEKIFKSFDKYESWAITKIEKFHKKYVTNPDDPDDDDYDWDENYDSDGTELINTIFPMLTFDRGSYDYADKIFTELLEILNWDWWREKFED